MKFKIANHASQHAFTLLELLVVLFIMGIVCALLLPAVMRAREAARRIACMNNLKQVGMALHTYQGACGQLPPAPSNTPWTLACGPYLELDPLRRAYDDNFDPYESPANGALGTRNVSVFKCPSQSSEIRVAPSGWVAANYALCAEAEGAPMSRFTDGTSHSALAGEIPARYGLAWITGPSLSLSVEGELHQGLFHVLFVDGSVRAIPTTVSETVIEAFRTPNSGDDPGSF